MRFWLDKGVSGFRMDVIPFISKDQAFPDLTPEQLPHPEFVYANGPRVHDYLQEMRREALSAYDVMTVGEAFGVTEQQAPLFVDERRGELDMIFNFDIVRIDRDGWRHIDWTLPALKAIYERLDAAVGPHGWNTVFLGNHDNPRAVSHFGDDSAEFRVPSAKALASMMLTQRGTPFIYQGEELGMTNFPFERIDQFDDVEVKGIWEQEVVSGPGGRRRLHRPSAPDQPRPCAHADAMERRRQWRLHHRRKAVARAASGFRHDQCRGSACRRPLGLSPLPAAAEAEARHAGAGLWRLSRPRPGA